MAETKITDNHFYFRIEYYNKKWEVTYSTDVYEEIDVYKDYISYNNSCPWCWRNYYKFEYKIDWDKLFIRCVEYIHTVDYSSCQISFAWYVFVRDWELNKDVLKDYFNNERKWEKTRCDAHRKFQFRDEIRRSLDRFEFKQDRIRCRFTNTAKDRIIKQIKNKNFKKD